MNRLPALLLWRAEGLRLRRLPLAKLSLGGLLTALLVCANSSGLDARRWREDTVAQQTHMEDLRRDSQRRLEAMPAGVAAATAAYQLGRSELGTTRMAAGPALGLGVKRLEALPHELRVSLESRQVDANTTSQLRNPLLADTGLPDLPAMVALLLPLVALVLCAGLLQEEREQGRWGLLRVQLKSGAWSFLGAALAWRYLALVLVAAIGTLPALLLDPEASPAAGWHWMVALAGFCLVWVALGALLSLLPWSSGTTLLAGIGLWLVMSFGVPAALTWMAQKEAPLPSRLAAIVQIRQAQQSSEEQEAELARAWYQRHPEIPARLPAVWPASFVTRTLEQDRLLAPVVASFEDSRARQAALIERWAWLSPGLSLVLKGQHLAGADSDSHQNYLQQVQDFEIRWREYFVPPVMDGQGLKAQDLVFLPRFEGSVDFARL